MTALDDGNGEHFCIQKENVAALKKALAGIDESLGRILAEAAGAHQASKRAADEAMAVRHELKDERARRERECDLRHRGIDVEMRDTKLRVNRLESHEDDDEPDTGMLDRDQLLLKVEAIRAEGEKDARVARWKVVGSVSLAIVSILGAAIMAVIQRWV